MRGREGGERNSEMERGEWPVNADKAKSLFHVTTVGVAQLSTNTLKIYQYMYSTCTSALTKTNLLTSGTKYIIMSILVIKLHVLQQVTLSGQPLTKYTDYSGLHGRINKITDEQSSTLEV